MFENIMGWLLILALPVVAVFAVVKLNTARKQKRAREQARREETLAILKREREASRMRTGMYAAKNTPPRARSSAQPVASTTTTDNSIDWVTPALIMATMNSNSGAVSARADESTNSVTFTEEKVSPPNSSWSSYNDSSSSSSWSSSSSDSSSSSSWD